MRTTQWRALLHRSLDNENTGVLAKIRSLTKWPNTQVRKALVGDDDQKVRKYSIHHRVIHRRKEGRGETNHLNNGLLSSKGDNEAFFEPMGQRVEWRRQCYDPLVKTNSETLGGRNRIGIK